MPVLQEYVRAPLCYKVLLVAMFNQTRGGVLKVILRELSFGSLVENIKVLVRTDKNYK